LRQQNGGVAAHHAAVRLQPGATGNHGYDLGYLQIWLGLER
jgi:hypothetical protein